MTYFLATSTLSFTCKWIHADTIFSILLQAYSQKDSEADTQAAGSEGDMQTNRDRKRDIQTNRPYKLTETENGTFKLTGHTN